MNNEAEIAKLVGTLAACYPSVQVSDETFTAYVEMLKDVPLGILETCVQQCAAESRFFPAIAEIRARVLSISQPQRLTPAEAWGEVVNTIRAVGYYGQPNFADPLVAKTVGYMDWQTLCSSENTVADRAHFMKMYEQIVNREADDQRLLPASRLLRAELTEGNERRLLQAG